MNAQDYEHAMDARFAESDREAKTAALDPHGVLATAREDEFRARWEAFGEVNEP